MNTNPQSQSQDRSLLDELERIAEEVRVRIHLAGMDIKDEWNKLEPRVFEARQKIDAATEPPRRLIEELVQRAKKIRDAL